ncbi:hypothetical protein BJY16_007464 [Actinoplanes octamycinicus]|uniref:Uncharacterized protein n=1 Tax=Actinoplanes octamycinicus TaxID=135948 RepID=A0A7W7H4R7_9ACTN|nr:hypothetical protein [Actinoplanes octamycinicus]GIE58629.1 hypothetical protein Aoc01nite_40310 [Actinoplanes octamycinicus]
MATGTRWAGSGRIAGTSDALAALTWINAAAANLATIGALAHAIQPATHTDLDAPDLAKQLPTYDTIRPLLPWTGLRRGTTIAAASSTAAAAARRRDA